MKLAIGVKWPATASKYVDGAYALLSIKPLETRFVKVKTTDFEAGPAQFVKQARDVTWEPQAWTADAKGRLEICGDSSVVINWLNGLWRVKFLPYERCVAKAHQHLHVLSSVFETKPRSDTSDFCRHIFRELNTMADRLANKYRNEWMLLPYTAPAKCIRVFFDGSRRKNKAAYGWVVCAFSPPTQANVPDEAASPDELSAWYPIASKSCLLPEGVSITSAELEAASNVISFLHAYYQGYAKAAEAIRTFPTMDYHTLHNLVLAEMV